jgi:hypothetical protein
MPFLAGLDWINRLTEPANQKRVHGTPKHLHADLYARMTVRLPLPQVGKCRDSKSQTEPDGRLKRT